MKKIRSQALALLLAGAMICSPWAQLPVRAANAAFKAYTLQQTALTNRGHSRIIGGSITAIYWDLDSSVEETCQGYELRGINRDDKEVVISQIPITETEYEIDASVSQIYKKLLLYYYSVDNGQNIYGTPVEWDNSAGFSPYLLQDGISGVKFPSQKEIKAKAKKLSPAPIANSFSKKPKLTAPCSPGKVSAKTLQSGVDTLNFIRYVAGIPSNVTINARQQELAQASALVNALNGSISHYPTKPDRLSEALYKKGYTGCSESNLAYGYNSVKSLYEAIVRGWMSDSDDYNIDRVGHRRWCLNPALGTTGFGVVNNGAYNFYSMYAFDKTNAEKLPSSGVHGVCWPARNMPLELFNAEDAWSISMGVPLPESSVKVTLVRTRDKKKWTFNSKNSDELSPAEDNYINVENSNYGLEGCVIFRPHAISYKDGDAFKVTVSAKDLSFSYNVNFFYAGLLSRDGANITEKASSAKSKTITTLKLTSFARNKKLVKGKTISKGKVTLKIGKKTYKTTAKKSGVFKIKLKTKLKKKQKLKVTVTKSGYKKKTKTFKVK